jgi:hypothetical protein
MARVQLYRVEFLVNSGSAVAGDVLDIFVDTDNVTTPAPPLSFQDDGIETEINGVLFSNDDGYYFNNDQTKYSIQEFNPQICAGTSLLTFSDGWALWPFVTYYSEENHFSCAVNPPTCDLIVVGIPLVTHATGDTSPDGSIEVTASSSLPIQYKISSDFVYNDGTAQNDGLFSGLLPGQHRIFLRDSANCQANVLVTVSVDNTYGVRFRHEYDDYRGHQTRIDITKRSYLGTIDEVCGWGNSPFTLMMGLEGNDDKMHPIAALSGELVLDSETDQKFIEIFTNDPNLYRIAFYKDFGSGFEPLWIGKVLKQQYAEDFKAPPYRVSIKGTDGLAELKELFLVQGDGQVYSGTIKAIELIAFILKQTRIELNIRVAINLYALTMVSTDADDPLDQAYVDFERFYLATNQPTLDFVLKAILESFGARIVQWENNWCITRVEEMCDDYDYRLFDKDGVYVSNGTYSPVLDLDFPQSNNDLILVDANQALEIRPSYGLFRVIYKLGLKPNVVKNGNFRLKSQYYNLGTSQGYSFSINKEGFTLVNAGYSIDESYEQIDSSNVGYKLTSYIIDAFASGNGGEAYIKAETIELVMGANNSLRINFRYKISSSYTYTNFLGVLNYFKVNVPYTKLRAQITFDDGTDVYYLTSDGRWTDEVNELIFFIDKVDEYVESEVLALQPPNGVAGGDFDIKLYLPFPYYTKFDDVADLKAFETYNGTDQTLPSGYRTELAVTVVVGPGTFTDLFYYELRQTSDAEDLTNYTIVEPDDYDGTNNPRKWVRVGYASTGDVAINNPKLTFTTVVDRIKVTYLTDGKDPIDTIVRTVGGESGNIDVLEKELILGSYQSLIRTDISFGIDIGLFYPNSIPGLTTQTTNILLAYLIYTGYYRDSSGTGYETWARDNISEADSLHGIMLKMMAAQYKRSSRLLRGSFKSKNSFFGFLNVLRNVNDNDRLFMPMGLSLDDKRCTYTGEMMELKNIFAAPGSDGSGESPYSSGFTTGFGQDFN